jgi:hypothetical protein
MGRSALWGIVVGFSVTPLLASCRTPRAAFPRTVSSSALEPLVPEFRQKYKALYPNRWVTRIGLDDEDWKITQNSNTGVVEARSVGFVIAYREGGVCYWERRRFWEDSSGPNTWAAPYVGKVVMTSQFGDFAAGKLDCKAAEEGGPQDSP